MHEKSTEVRDYTAPGTVEHRISKSPYEYLKLKEIRDGGRQYISLFSDTSVRYGEKTTPTTRRTTHDSEIRNYY